MIRIAIVEDEDLYVNQLTEYVDNYQKEKGEKLEVTIFRDGDAITSGYKAQFDIILMDIQMRFVDGMTAAEEIRKIDSQVVIIFITNMAQYAIRGYEVGALDYILKPVTYFSFSQKLGKAIAKAKQKGNKIITVPIRGGVMRQQVSDIYYIESEGHNLIYHTRDGEYVSTGTMKAVEEVLAELHFSRCNKGYLVNLEHVDGIQDKCAMVHGKKLIISRPRMNAFMQELTKFWGEVN